MSKLIEEIILKVKMDSSEAERKMGSLGSTAKKATSELDSGYSVATSSTKKFIQQLKAQDEQLRRSRSRDAKVAMLALAYAGYKVAKAGIEVSLSFDRVKNSLTAVSGSTAGASKMMKHISAEADRLGLNTLATAKGFAMLTASAKGTALEGAGVEKIFRSVSEASSALGLSTDDTEGALKAISQMMSKGTVSAEELRGQLGERIPGAFNMAAKAMNMTTQELGKALESGSVDSVEFLQKLSKEMSNTYAGPAMKNSQSNIAKMNRLANTWDNILKDVGDTLMEFSPIVQEGANSLHGFVLAMKDIDERTGAIDKMKSLMSYTGDIIKGTNIALNEFFGVKNSSGGTEAEVAKLLKLREENIKLKSTFKEQKIDKEIEKIDNSLKQFQDTIQKTNHMDFIRKELKLTTEGFKKFESVIKSVLEVAGDQDAMPLLRDVLKEQQDLGNMEIGKDVEIPQSFMDGLKQISSLANTVSGSIKNMYETLKPTEQPFDALNESLEETKKNLDLAKKLGISGSEIGKAQSAISEARKKGYSEEKILEELAKLKAKGAFESESISSSGGGRTAYEKGSESANELLQGNKIALDQLEWIKMIEKNTRGSKTAQINVTTRSV